MAKKTGSWRQSMVSFTGKLRVRMYEQVFPLEGWTITPACYSAPGKTERTGEPKPIQIGESWFEQTAYFENRFAVPPEFNGRPVWLRFVNQGESLLYRDGIPVTGLDPNRSLCFLGEGKCQRVEISVESTIRWQNFAHAGQTGRDYGFQVFSDAALVTINEDLRYCAAAGEALAEVLAQTGSPWAEQLLTELRVRVKPDDLPDALASQAKEARAWLTEQLDASRNAKGEFGRIFAVGHSHLDLAYLWPARETVRKCGRTFSNMLGLMERYPEYCFSQSQGYLYDAAREFHPSLYEKVKNYAARNRWEPVGGMYVEPDGNLPDGESFIRQFVYGQEIFRREFGQNATVGWLPDTFGQSAILPQIFRGCGVDSFYSAKLRGNEYAPFPYSTYWWEGIDGSRLLAVLDPYENYHGEMTFAELQKGQKNLREQREQFPQTPAESMYCFGYGDGGGGATEEMLLKQQVFDAVPGLPHVENKTAGEFFAFVKAQGEGLPVWYGEQYFDQHQGTLTSHALLKRLNRLGERALREAEFFVALSGGAKQSKPELDQLWKTLLFNQFHDILPGSCLQSVFEQAAEENRQVIKKAESLQDRCAKQLFVPENGCFTVVNTLSFARDELVRVPGEQLAAQGILPESELTITDLSTGEACPIQRFGDGSAAFLSKALPAAGWRVYQAAKGKAQSLGTSIGREEKDCFVLENELLQVTVSKGAGELTSLLWKEKGRELLAASGNRLTLYEQLYENYDAWNLHPQTLEHPAAAETETTVALGENGWLEGRIRVEKRFSRSRITQEIVLRAHSGRVEFVTEADWQETGRLLRAEFDTDIFSPKAQYDLSYGNMERSTRSNTSLERSQIEVAAHKWVDFSDGGCGLALLSDCKYGYSVKGGKMTVTLLKSSKYPDPQCDKGLHRFTYALYPHTGDFKAGGGDREGLSLNAPALIFAGKAAENSCSALNISEKSVLSGAIKPAEDGNGVILRLYENHGQALGTSVDLGLPFTRVFLCDMLENPLQELQAENGSIRLQFRPYEIKTVRLAGK